MCAIIYHIVSTKSYWTFLLLFHLVVAYTAQRTHLKFDEKQNNKRRSKKYKNGILHVDSLSLNHDSHTRHQHQLLTWKIFIDISSRSTSIDTINESLKRKPISKIKTNKDFLISSDLYLLWQFFFFNFCLIRCGFLFKNSPFAK